MRTAVIIGLVGLILAGGSAFAADQIQIRLGHVVICGTNLEVRNCRVDGRRDGSETVSGCVITVKAKGGAAR